jgi:predicted O-methyltransferase YrrM
MLRSLAASKPAGKFLELGTGTGLSTSWILDGMDLKSSLVTIDNNPELVAVADQYLGSDKRLSIVHADAHEWISENSDLRFDYIFADAWPGKYSMLEEVLAMLNEGGIYIIDDMLPQPNWPEGHDEKVKQLITELELKDNLLLTKLEWSSGVILAVKK